MRSFHCWTGSLLCAEAAGAGDVKAKMLNGFNTNGKTFKVHLDGYSFLPYLEGNN